MSLFAVYLTTKGATRGAKKVKEIHTRREKQRRYDNCTFIDYVTGYGKEILEDNRNRGTLSEQKILEIQNRVERLGPQAELYLEIPEEIRAFLEECYNRTKPARTGAVPFGYTYDDALPILLFQMTTHPDGEPQDIAVNILDRIFSLAAVGYGSQMTMANAVRKAAENKLEELAQKKEGLESSKAKEITALQKYYNALAAAAEKHFQGQIVALRDYHCPSLRLARGEAAPRLIPADNGRR